MRQIRFRVWDNENKEYFKPIYKAYKGELLDLSVGLGGDVIRRTLEYCAEHVSKFPNRYLLEQFTGLRDKNNVDIYEGDIVTYSNRIGKIDWHYFQAAFDLTFVKVIEGEPYIELKDPIPVPSWRFKLEVIGNIHENKELL